jgi:hypothetical protein
MEEHDLAALRRSMSIASEDPLRARQLDDMLKDRSWFDVASFASSCCQSRFLNLKPWESAPADTDNADSGPAAELLRRMLAAGLSKFEPDPASAILAAARAAKVAS